VKTRKVLFVALAVASIFVIASIAGAVCPNTGKIIYTYRNASGSTMYVYVSPNTTFPTFYYYFVTTDYRVMDQITSAQAGQLKVNITGNRSTCPTTGLYRYGGAITYFRTYTIY
jgi:hypothetical protein